MTKLEIIDAFEAGDMGDVEFVEMALEAGIEIQLIERVLQSNRDNAQD